MNSLSPQAFPLKLGRKDWPLNKRIPPPLACGGMGASRHMLPIGRRGPNSHATASNKACRRARSVQLCLQAHPSQLAFTPEASSSFASASNRPTNAVTLFAGMSKFDSVDTMPSVCQPQAHARFLAEAQAANRHSRDHNASSCACLASRHRQPQPLRTHRPRFPRANFPPHRKWPHRARSALSAAHGSFVRHAKRASQNGALRRTFQMARDIAPSSTSELPTSRTPRSHA